MNESSEFSGGPGDAKWEAQFRAAGVNGCDVGASIDDRPMRPALLNDLLGDRMRNPTRDPLVAMELYLKDRAEVDGFTVERYRRPGTPEANARAAWRAKRIAFGLPVD